ncbi:DEAD/DEAH box helicase [Sediminibacillus halophilus]|uniref:ATP-dependent RNA helicase CshB n=1 Tax=Sediminibacillus halophilus TaxID=482461 RepID=A0A1G9YJA3_9BACI|nr:DEAD/DEAH box helicase [Sediminibacillus halophilus]SDN08583.1 ATP-dependent RNA helicase CshB [Sediminibacillus halophilus]
MKNHHFRQYSLHPLINDVIDRLEFHKPTPIQEKVIPAVLRGESVIGQSHTGSGKTHAYLLPLFNEMEESKKQVQFVVTAPTRELAIQIYDEVRKIIHYANKDHRWNAKLLIGGTDKKRSIEKLKEQPHIVVGTPGRILDLVEEGALDLYNAKAFVVDEADLMLDLGFIQEVDKTLVKTNQEIQLLVFSATIPERLQPFLKKYLENPAHLTADEHKLSPETMEHRLVPLRHRSVSEMVYRISGAIQPYLAIIFTNGKELANQLAEELTEKGMEVGLIHGGLSPRERKRMLKEIQNLRYQYIVATDLAARGIDIKGVSHVINAQLPKEEEFYIHRVGRTARAGMEGTAINLYTDQDVQLIEKLEKKGLTFTSFDVKNGEWEEVKAWNERSTRKKAESDTEKEAWRKVRKPKKVKPGYKKKMKQQKEQVKKKLNRNKYKK